ncbi:DUF2301 domain-containing membrane protein [Psychromonas hadalis]|uniref:DUF2301 domain-containing membrane protein n=1 Tax=Psychromonas hadalis TaxID=211669 RepID=UPI0003B7ABA7|nr:DUF2301 domain-containing membrane protein [Psychromonas hadalis]
MADPHIKENLDKLDKVSIILYRTGMVVTGLGLFTLALQQMFYPHWFKRVLIVLALGALLQASSLHIYSKVVRWFLVNASWFGLWMLTVAFITTGAWTSYLSLGAFIITFSGLAYKESFCFSLTILKAIPILLIISWLLIILSLNQLATGTLLLSSLLYLYMAWRKINMPLHFDLGDRSKYEV